MIFVTVGTQLAFDRMVHAIDGWAAMHPDVQFFAQIGPSAHPPRHVQHADFVPPQRADELMRTAELVVAHAGMGSILTALRYRKPIVVVPRKAALREHRNDHQMATARWLEGRQGVTVAWDEQALLRVLERRGELEVGPGIDDAAAGPLVQRLHAYLHGE